MGDIKKASTFARKIIYAYNTSMKHAIRSLFPAYFSTDSVFWYRLILAFVYIFLVIMQLFTYEKFATTAMTFGLPGGSTTALVLASLVPLLEVLSLPFLLSMNLPRRLLLVSRGATLFVAFMWFVLSIWLVVAAHAAESGIFGATIVLPSGIWMIGYTAVLFAVAVLCTWPLSYHKNRP